MIIWLNGPFGVGKTTTTAALLQARRKLASFDAEAIGEALGHALEQRLPVRSFQEWRSWRRLTIAALIEVGSELGADLVVPQTVLTEAVWLELADGLAARGQPVHAFTLHVEPAEHLRRIERDLVEPKAYEWRSEQWPEYEAALPWLERETRVIDTTALGPTAVADEVLRLSGA